MSEWEKFVVPDWVVEKHNQRVHGEMQDDPYTTGYTNTGKDFYEEHQKWKASTIAAVRSRIEESRKKNPRAYADTTRSEMDTNAVIFILVLCFIFSVLIF
ncbi:MAG: hypothetical protein J6B02_03035 [Selenomonadales bacterium]|nr:hypothetical protein [Selenomonadales bacterium]